MKKSIKEQQKILSLRWTAIPISTMTDTEMAKYRSMANDFYSDNRTLRDYIHSPESLEDRNAWTDAKNHKTNTYLVVDTVQQEIVFYFSICCGMLYSDLTIDDSYTEAELTFLNIYRQALATRDRNAAKDLELLAGSFGLTASVESMKKMLRSSRRDQSVTNESDVTTNVVDTFPAIELTHFCRNKQYFGKPLGIELKTGAFIFWEFVVPEIKRLSKRIGAKYLYLFAADDRAAESRKLLEYYQEHLKFYRINPLNNRRLIKPKYDYDCFSMMQEIELLDVKKKEYYGSFFE